MGKAWERHGLRRLIAYGIAQAYVGEKKNLRGSNPLLRKSRRRVVVPRPRRYCVYALRDICVTKGRKRENVPPFSLDLWDAGQIVWKRNSYPLSPLPSSVSLADAISSRFSAKFQFTFRSQRRSTVARSIHDACIKSLANSAKSQQPIFSRRILTERSHFDGLICRARYRKIRACYFRVLARQRRVNERATKFRNINCTWQARLYTYARACMYVCVCVFLFHKLSPRTYYDTPPWAANT